MGAPMAILAILSIFAGALQIPGVTHVIESFLEPTFEASRFMGIDVGSGIEALALTVGALSALAGIGLAWFVYIRRPGTTARLVERLPRLHDFLAHKWYFDELYDRAIVRPTLAFGVVDVGRLRART